MNAWLLERITDLAQNSSPLRLAEIPLPEPAAHEIRIRVSCCAVCHTELDEIEGRTPPPQYPVVPGHQVVGHVDACGSGATRFSIGERVGVAWIFSACETCEYCTAGRENLCSAFCATGRDANGGYAEYMIVPEAFACRIPAGLSDTQAAPLLCAGAIGYRAVRLSGIGNGQVLGLTGFGASGHLVLKMVRHLFPATTVFVFARSAGEQAFARALGAAWAGDFDEQPPVAAHAIIDTTPVWSAVVAALGQLRSGGRLVINAIRKEDADKTALLGLRYADHLWMEKEITSVANITRADVDAFLALAAAVPLLPEVQLYPFGKANEALVDLKHKHVKGAKVLVIEKS